MQKGFTVVELVVSLSILVLLLSVGLPGLSRQIQDNRIEAAAETLYQAIQLTRTQAVSTNNRAIIRNAGSWSEGWEIFLDTNNNAVRDTDEKLISHVEALPAEVIVGANRNVSEYISFIGTGASRFAGQANLGGLQMGTLTVCPRGQGPGFQLILSGGGRVRVDNLPPQRCATAGN